jgi:hypothetical protein
VLVDVVPADELLKVLHTARLSIEDLREALASLAAGRVRRAVSEGSVVRGGNER